MGGSPPRASAGQGSPTKGDPLLPRWPSWSGAGSSIIRPSSRAGSLPRARLPVARIRPTSWAGSLSRRCPSEGPPARSTMCSASQASMRPQQPLVRRRRQTPPAMASFIDLATAAFLHPLSSTSTHQFRDAMQSAPQAVPRRTDLSLAERYRARSLGAGRGAGRPLSDGLPAKK